MKLKLTITALLLAVVTSLVSAGAMAAEYTLKLHHLLGPKAPAHSKMLVPWAKKIQLPMKATTTPRPAM